MPLIKRIALPLTFLLCSFFSATVSFAQNDSLANRPELSLPLINQKLVIAHCMTHIIRYEGRVYEDGANPAYYPITAPVGGTSQVHVMSDSIMSHATRDQAVEFEMRAAKRIGIDGFQFYYPMGDLVMDTIIEAYFRVAQEKNIDFKFTFCICPFGIDGLDENQKLLHYAIRINKILNDVGRDNPRWLRTPDGRLIVYLWYGDKIADYPADMLGRPSYFYIADAYRRLANACSDKFACVFSINKENMDKPTLDDLLDYFPAVWLWTEAYEHKGEQDMVAAYCKKRKRTYTASLFNDFYTSKVLKPNDETWPILSNAESESVGLGGMQRKYMGVGLSTTFRRLFEFAIKDNDNLVNVITWNDYPEGHHMAPEVNHNFGFAVLLNYYKALWEGKPNPYADRDVAIAFFKKYKSDVTPKPYKVSVETIGRTLPDLPTPTINAIEDSIEVVTILPQPGQLVVNGETVDAPAGLSVHRFKSQPGAVSVAVQRNGVVTKSFVTPEWITDAPLRTDRITYTFDTEFQSFFHDIFGDIPPIYSTQYNKNINK
jgi:glycosyl hydrolase family 71